MWSTIKTLPATLPETSFKDGVSSAGVTGAVCQSALDFVGGVGPQGAGADPWIAGLG